MRTHRDGSETGRGGIDAQNGTEYLNIGAGAPGVAIGAGSFARAVHDLGKGGETAAEHGAPIAELVEVAVAFADLGQGAVQVEAEEESGLGERRVVEDAQDQVAGGLAIDD